MRLIRQQGWYSTRGEVTPGVTGIAAPIFDPQDEIAGSISLTFPEPDMPEDRVSTIGERVGFSARVINNTLR